MGFEQSVSCDLKLHVVFCNIVFFFLHMRQTFKETIVGIIKVGVN